LPWHGNLYQGERASEKRGISFGQTSHEISEVAAKSGVPVDRVNGPDPLSTPFPGKMAIQNVQSPPAGQLASPLTFSAGPLREELALARRILDLSRNPSKARDLCLLLVRRLERLTESVERNEVG
jgi:hypothetical protein